MRTTTFPRTMHTRQSSCVRQSIHALLAWSLDVLRTWQQRSQGRRALLQLDEWLLKDNGLSRAEAAREARKPFWRP